MSETKNFRITLDLSRFFNDHRKLAKIFINSTLKSVQDLQNRIHEIFGLTGFYLNTQNHFLPLSEDVRVLINDEIVCAVPCSSPLEQRSLISPDSSGVKPPLETITEDSSDPSFVKKKLKKRHSESISDNDELPTKKKKRKKSKCEPSPTISDKIKKHKTLKELRIVEQSVRSIESVKKCDKIKESLLNLKAAVYPSNYDNLGRPMQVGDSVRLSRHVDTPNIKLFSKYAKPQNNTEEYLAKKKINIVKIDIINDTTPGKGDKTVAEKLPEPELRKDPESPPENIVKTIVNYIEKNISPTTGRDSKNESLNSAEKRMQSTQVKASDYAKNSLDKTDDKTSIGNKSELDISSLTESFENSTYNDNWPKIRSEDDQGLDISRDIQSSVSSVNTSSKLTETKNNGNTNDYSLRNSVGSIGNSINSVITELDCLSMEISSTSLKENSKDTSHTNSENTRLKKRSSSFRAYSGVGNLLEQLKESDSVVSQESDSSIQFITKRKRVRHRKRKSKKGDSANFNSSFGAPFSLLPPLKVEACPKLHITFGEEGTEQSLKMKMNDAEAPEVGNKMEEVKDVIRLSEELDEDPVLEDKFIFSDDSILKAPMMVDKLPKTGDIIAFQLIKLSENYTPTVSNYVVGMVLAWEPETKTVQFKILSGEKELQTPSGKLSLNNIEQGEKEKISDLTILWVKLLLPKLLFP